MCVGDLVWDIMFQGIGILSPTERWRAAGASSRESPAAQIAEYVGPVLGAVGLALLILLLWWVLHRQRPVKRKAPREVFVATASRRGLSGRERQILLAIVARSGLGRSQEIFTTVDAFDRGATKLLAECGRTRRPHEIERLKTEVTGLRQKLGFQSLRASGGLAQSRKASSRDIPVGKHVEVTWQQGRGGPTLRGEVVRNDDLELAIAVDGSVAGQTGDAWRVRYAYGASLWEYDTTAVSCEDSRLTLNHVDHVRFVNRRRFIRAKVEMPAVVAAFPFMRRASAGLVTEGQNQLSTPEFVPGTVRQLAGPGLLVEAPLDVCAGDRVLVAFRPTEDSELGDGFGSGFEHEYVMEDIGVVRHCREAAGGLAIAVELVGLTETDIDAMVRLSNSIVSQSEDVNGEGESDRANDAVHAAAVQGR